MKILIQNLGSIKNNKQVIDLNKNFYVFVGDNNSGKTYVSQLLWTVFNAEVIQKFSEQVETTLDFENSKSVFEITRELLDDLLDKYSRFLKKELANTFNIEDTPYTETILGKFSIKFDYNWQELEAKEMEVISNISTEDSEDFELFVLNKKAKSSMFSFEDKDLGTFFKNIPAKHKRRINADIPELKKTAFVGAVIQLLLNHNHSTLFLPANRSFYATFYQYIYEIERERREKDVLELIRLIEKNGNKKSEKLKNLSLFKRPYTQPVSNLFEKIFDLNKEINISNHYTSLLEKLMNVMGGDIEMNSLEGVSMLNFTFKINKTNKELPMYMSSSSVNQLTLLYLYFKYWAEEKANFLMLDEPEENLNPKNQIKLLDVLIQFANLNDNKVLITTHSPILADTINNYVYLDVVKNKFGTEAIKFIDENGLKFLSPEISIAKEKVGVYFFDGKQIIDYQSNEYGAYFRDFKNVSDGIENNARLMTDFIYLKEQQENG